MSIIIRLQNLPITAKSADVRNFFGGLRIPDGGVHILGGENGDAFIGFNSDEDARLAMRKDGGKIKDSRIKLFLSSRMEMQYEVEKLTKGTINNSPSHKSYSEERAIVDEDSRYISQEVQHDPVSQFPVGFGSRPRKRSKSSLRSHESVSPESKAQKKKKAKASNRMPNYVNLRQIDLKQNKLDSPDLSNYNYPANNPSTSEIQADLERRITEVIEKNSELMARGAIGYQENNVPGFTGENVHVDFYPGHVYQGQNFPTGIVSNNFAPFPLPPPPAFNNVQQQFLTPEFQPSHVMNMGQQHVVPPLVPPPDMLMTGGEVDRQQCVNGFYVTISGLDPLWNFKEIQVMLKGIYAPQNNIRWEIDNTGCKTGTAFVKLMNRADFDEVVRRMTFFFDGRRITVSECPDFVSRSYFTSSSDNQNEYMQQNRDLCYMLKGLPFTCTYEDIISFFQGFTVADIVVIYGKYGKDNKATGTGFVSFINRRDFEEAFQLNGKKISHRYIEMIPSSEKDMMRAKRMCPSAQTFTSYSQIIAQKNLPPSRRPLVAVISGLPSRTSVKSLNTFFSDSGLKPDAFHITLNKKKECDGRTYVEFTNFRDFDLALKLHGSTFKENIICIKQMLYDEMVKILDIVKAKHHFETPVSATSVVPEKVPYLWEPPDDYDEQDKLNFPNSRFENPYRYSLNSTTKKEFNPIMGPNAFNQTGMPNRFLQDDRRAVGRNFDPHFKHEIFLEQEVKRSPPYMNETRSFNTRAKNFASDFREPIKFNVNKPSAVSTKTSETFESSMNVEKKSKLSKLSPEKEDTKVSLSKTKDVHFRKKTPERKQIDFKKKSPERKDSNPERRDPDVQKGFKGRKNFNSEKKIKERDYRSDMQRKSDSRDTFSRNHHERESKRSYEVKVVSHRRSLSPSYSERKLKECVVHMSNVSTSVGTPDLVEFLRDFVYYPDSIIRRYTDTYEPTEDVRVTFYNRAEAEMAIAALNGRHLRGHKVSMFIP